MDCEPRLFHKTKHGSIYHTDALDYLATCKVESVDLVMTSPPFGLVRKKEYGNVDAGDYVDWFKAFAKEFKRVLKPKGSLVIDIGGAWVPGQPSRSLYQYELVIMLCRELGFHLAQEFFWWSPSKLPSPAEWVTVRRIRVKDAVNCVWWLSPTPWPKASNRRVRAPYSEAMLGLLKNGYQPKLRPSGHDIGAKFSIDNGAAIPPNLIAIPNTESNTYYLRSCRDRGLRVHPARFPADLPEFFIRMLTDQGDLVMDPFAGSCVTGEVAERLRRRWVCVELVEEYLKGALARFQKPGRETQAELFAGNSGRDARGTFYKVYHPGALWNGTDEEPLPDDGGYSRRMPRKRVVK